MTVDTLKASKLGKLVVKLVKDPPTPGELKLSDPCCTRCIEGHLPATPVITISIVLDHTSPVALKLQLGAQLISHYLSRIIQNVSNFRCPIYLCYAAIKDMASNIERRWRQLITVVDTQGKGGESSPTDGESCQIVIPRCTQDPNLGIVEAKSKKRKSVDATLSRPMPPAKKLAIGTTTSTKPISVKKEIKPIVTPAVKDAKSDSSFFSAPKQKPKLPSFKKAAAPPVTIKKEHDSNVAQPSSMNPFEDILKSMGRRKNSPNVATPPATNANTPPQMSLGKNSKKKKTVTWAPDGQLESIRLIEKAIYEDDPVDVSRIPFIAVIYINVFSRVSLPKCCLQGLRFSTNLRDLDRGEGAALHAHLFEEQIDWSEPPRKQTSFLRNVIRIHKTLPPQSLRSLVTPWTK